LDEDLTLRIQGMTCPTCEGTLQRVLSRLPGIRSVAADHTTREVRTIGDPTPDEGSIREAVEDAGYDLVGVS